MCVSVCVYVLVYVCVCVSVFNDCTICYVCYKANC